MNQVLWVSRNLGSRPYIPNTAEDAFELKFYFSSSPGDGVIDMHHHECGTKDGVQDFKYAR